MNWSDERYVRLYTRDTVTWKRWGWETRAVMALLLRKVDRSGVLDTGAHDKVEAFALLLEVPIEVAHKAVAELLKSGTLVESETGFVLPTFIEAQEAPQTDAARQRESREKRRAANMRNAETACHTPSHAVTDGHNLSLQPSLAVPSVPLRTGAVAPPPPRPSKPKRVEADPRHQPLVDAICREFAEAMGQRMPFSGRDAVGVKALLATGTDPTVIVEAWRRALRHRGFPTVRTPSELHQHLAHFVGSAPPTADAKATRSPSPIPDWSGVQAGEVAL